ncbi:DNA polymerase III subunit delta [Virgibacillus necropolis]|uniref:DNA polymerase III subunit delta n=1 Tax=Virgibacillus necropolis TaxID=163877 RepID=A0A221MC08_9BACI|nr:DNA polymerase III subunit delta [Virgibacillus necropolis]ASN05174.1 DNA polymerase III subunit delta [Virgibacillus necropolis]
MSYLEIAQKIKKNQLAPTYLLYGTESYFIQDIKKQLTNAILPDGDIENLSTYDLDETPIQEVISDTETYPLFGERKLIIAHNPSFLKAKPSKLPFEHDLDRLQFYIENPVDYATIIFIAEYEKIDERKKVTKVIKKNAAIAKCDPIKEHELSKWIKTIANDYHITIEPKAFDVIETELQANLHLLQNEMMKFALYVGEGGNLTKDDAEMLISHTLNNSSLRLVDAVIERDIRKAITIYRDLLKMKEEPIAMVALLAYQFRTLLRVKLLKQKGYSQAQIQKQLGIHPFVVKIALSRESKFTIEQLSSYIDKLTNADADMKQGRMEKELAFDLLLYDLTNSRSQVTKSSI